MFMENRSAILVALALVALLGFAPKAPAYEQGASEPSAVSPSGPARIFCYSRETASHAIGMLRIHLPDGDAEMVFGDMELRTGVLLRDGGGPENAALAGTYILKFPSKQPDRPEQWVKVTLETRNWRDAQAAWSIATGDGHGVVEATAPPTPVHCSLKSVGES